MWPHIKLRQLTLQQCGIWLKHKYSKIEKLCSSSLGNWPVREQWHDIGQISLNNTCCFASYLGHSGRWPSGRDAPGHIFHDQDTNPFGYQPSVTHRILARDRLHQMRAVACRPCGFHEDMTPSHSKSWKEKNQKFHSIPFLSNRKKAATARREMKLSFHAL